jgi:hypothetical protein
MPFASAFISIGMVTPKRWLDSGFPCCRSKLEVDEKREKWEHRRAEKEEPGSGDTAVAKFKEEVENRRATKKQDIFNYVKLYAGPEFKMHSNYAKVILLIYVTLMYGLLLPVLFPICVLALFNIFTTDTLMLTYWYQRPPMYDDMIYRKALKILALAPILTFSFGYWAMSN